MRCGLGVGNVHQPEELMRRLTPYIDAVERGDDCLSARAVTVHILKNGIVILDEQYGAEPKWREK